jgi:succinate dehydrogenase / fumarate reductase cytochrome b subunit
MAKTPADPYGRPVFLNLLRFHFPVGAVASFLHRVTGALLVLAVPTGLGLAEYSTRSASHFRWVAAVLDTPVAAILGAVVLAALVHHLVAGVRVMLMDIGVGVHLKAARLSAWGSLAAAGVAGVLALLALWPAGEGGHGL